MKDFYTIKNYEDLLRKKAEDEVIDDEEFQRSMDFDSAISDLVENYREGISEIKNEYVPKIIQFNDQFQDKIKSVAEQFGTDSNHIQYQFELFLDDYLKTDWKKGKEKPQGPVEVMDLDNMGEIE